METSENTQRAFRVGIAGPVGSGKTALVDRLSKILYPRISLAVVTNDIYTKEDAEFLLRQGTLTLDRVRGVETGGCPHSAIREDASMNLEAIADLEAHIPGLELVFVESGGDNLAASFSPGATKFHAKAVLASFDQTCWSSIKLIWPHMWGPRSK